MSTDVVLLRKVDQISDRCRLGGIVLGRGTIWKVRQDNRERGATASKVKAPLKLKLVLRNLKQKNKEEVRSRWIVLIDVRPSSSAEVVRYFTRANQMLHASSVTSVLPCDTTHSTIYVTVLRISYNAIYSMINSSITPCNTPLFSSIRFSRSTKHLEAAFSLVVLPPVAYISTRKQLLWVIDQLKKNSDSGKKKVIR